MKLLQIIEPGHVRWKEVPRPDPRPGEILLKVSAVASCPNWDRSILGGNQMFEGRPLKYPYVPGEPGHEVVGTVAAMGAGAEGPPIGTRVAAWRDPGGRRQGCYAQYVALGADDVLPVPEDLPDEDVASLELAMCMQVSFDQLMGRDGVRDKRVGISGLGPSGLVAVQMAKAYGAREIVAFDPVPDRRALSLELGADVVLAPDAASFPAGRTGKMALDSAIDTTGIKQAIDFLIERTNETVTLFGVLRDYVGFGPDHWWGGFALLGYGSHNRGAAERALERIRERSVRLSPLVTHKLPMSRYADGVELLRRKEAIKVLFRAWEE